MAYQRRGTGVTGREDCLRGQGGSGTSFFANCNLRCLFCQNFQISRQAQGRAVTAEELAELMLQLQDQGCHNINEADLMPPEDEDLVLPKRRIAKRKKKSG